MKALLASMAAFGMFAVAAPASAHEISPIGFYGGGPAYSSPYAFQSARQIERLRFQVRQGLQTGMLNRWEAQRFLVTLRNLDSLRIHYIRSRGMSGWEARDLNMRIQRVRFELRREFWNGRSYGRFDDQWFEHRDNRFDERRERFDNNDRLDGRFDGGDFDNGPDRTERPGPRRDTGGRFQN